MVTKRSFEMSSKTELFVRIKLKEIRVGKKPVTRVIHEGTKPLYRDDFEFSSETIKRGLVRLADPTMTVVLNVLQKRVRMVVSNTKLVFESTIKLVNVFVVKKLKFLALKL